MGEYSNFGEYRYSEKSGTATALTFESILLFIVTKRRLGFHVFIWGRS